MSSTIAPGAPSVIEIQGNGVTARATIALATVTRRGVWNAKMSASAVAEKKRVKKLREQYSAEEWPGLHAAPGDAEVFTTPEGIEASGALCSEIIGETLQSLRLTHDDGTVEQVDRAGAALALDRHGLLQAFGLQIIQAHAVRPSRPSSPEYSGGEGASSTSSANSTSSPTT